MPFKSKKHANGSNNNKSPIINMLYGWGGGGAASAEMGSME